MNRIKIGGQSIDLDLISYVDLNYKVQGGVSRVVLGLNNDSNNEKQRDVDRLFFSDNEAEQLRQFFTKPEIQNHVVVFST